MGSNPGSIAASIPYGPDAIVRQRQDLENQVKENAFARSLAASQMGNGGTLKIDGSLEVSGSITVPGTLASAGAVSAATTISAGGAITGASVTATAAVTGASVIATGGVTAASLSVSGSASVGGDIGVTGYLFTPAGYAFDITYTRRAAWLGNDGRLGWASSSITAKELVDSIAEPDVLAILDRLISHHYHRLPELAKHEANPDYHVATEWGGIAEEFHELGLWQVVIYEWDVQYDLRDVVDVDGEPITNAEGYHLKERIQESEKRVEGSEPRVVGLHYELLGLLALVGLRQHRREHLDLVEELRLKGVIA